MTDDAGAKLLAAVEALSLEIRGLRETMSRDSVATEEIADLRQQAADYMALKARNATRRKKNRLEKVSRDSSATNDNPAESQETVSRDSRGTSQVLKALSFQDLDQQQKKELATSRDSAATPKAEPKTRAVWTAYLAAYRLKYGTDPVRNKTVNAKLAAVVDRLGTAAPEVATYYLGHRDAQYVRDRHGVGLLLRDCEKLHTDWQRDEQVTGTQAHLEERTAANMGGWARFLKQEAK